MNNVIERIEVNTSRHEEYIDITSRIKQALRHNNAEKGICIVYVPHTTAGITINENADPAVIHDMDEYLKNLVPWNDRKYRHMEGNSAAHIKASFFGSSVNLIVDSGDLVLGTWQSVFFSEFDGPRRRSVIIKFISG